MTGTPMDGPGRRWTIQHVSLAPQPGDGVTDGIGVGRPWTTLDSSGLRGFLAEFTTDCSGRTRTLRTF